MSSASAAASPPQVSVNSQSIVYLRRISYQPIHAADTAAAAHMDAMLAAFADERRTKFTNGADRERVAHMYRELRERMVALDDYERTLLEINKPDRTAKGSRNGQTIMSFEHARRAARQRKKEYDLLTFGEEGRGHAAMV